MTEPHIRHWHERVRRVHGTNQRDSIKCHTAMTFTLSKHRNENVLKNSFVELLKNDVYDAEFTMVEHMTGATDLISEFAYDQSHRSYQKRIKRTLHGGLIWCACVCGYWVRRVFSRLNFDFPSACFDAFGAIYGMLAAQNVTVMACYYNIRFGAILF